MRTGGGLEALLRPRSIAIIGASQDPTRIGGRPLQLLLKCAGAIYPAVALDALLVPRARTATDERP